MNKEVLEKANNLILDIELLSIILHERETDPGYVIVNAWRHKRNFSDRFENDLYEWMEKKKEEYEKEFEQLKWNWCVEICRTKIALW